MLPKSSNKENHSFKKSKQKIAQSVGFAAVVCSLCFIMTVLTHLVFVNFYKLREKYLLFYIVV